MWESNGLPEAPDDSPALHAGESCSGGIDMVFVCMPYAAVERPSLALGTLTAVLEREGLSSRVIYANLEFAARVGRQAYEVVNNSEITLQLGEWTFSEAVFGQQGDIDAFIKGLVSCGYTETGLRELLQGLRLEAARYLDELAQRVLALQPRIVGCTSMFQQHCASLGLLQRIRAQSPGTVTMLGGANCEGEMGAATHRQYPWVDFVVSGEADKLLPELCRRILARGAGIPVHHLPEGVLGPASRRVLVAAGAAAAPAVGRASITDLDELPIPNFDDYFEQLQASPLHGYVIPGLLIETSRGCWWGAKHHCTFCGLNGSGMAFRAKSQARVQQEVSQLAARYRLKRFMAVDNILDNKYFSQVLPFLAEAGDMLWFYETKANLTRTQVSLLSQAGVRWIQPGIEAMDDGLLKLLRKGCSTVINVQLLKWAYDYGVWVMWNHLHGAPGEDPEWYEHIADWLPLIAHLQPPSGGSMTRIRFDRFSPYFNEQADFALDLKPCWGYGQVYPVPEKQLEQQAYFFRNDGHSAPTPTRLAAMLSEWATRFYAPTTRATTLPRRSDDAPVLAWVASGYRQTVRDTRPCAVGSLHELSELEGQVCHALDSAQHLQGLVQALRHAGSTVPEREIGSALQRLVDLKIIAEFNGKFLCLVTSENPVPYKSFSEFAGGMFSLTPTHRTPPKPETPWDVSLRELFVSST